MKTSSKESEEDKVEAFVLPNSRLFQDSAKVCGKATPCIDKGSFERSKGTLNQSCQILAIHLWGEYHYMNDHCVVTTIAVRK